MHDSLFGMLQNAGISYDYLPLLKREEILRIITNYQGLIVRSKTKIDVDFLKFATNLRFIGRAGAGLDLIDLEEANRRNIKVFAANEGNRDAVAEHVIGLLLSLTNNLHTADREVRQGVWRREPNRGNELKNKTVGLIGFGNNGQATAEKLSGFGVKILAFDKFKKNSQIPNVQLVEMEEIFEQADILSLHIPLTAETNGLVSSEFLQKFKKLKYLINASRGEIVNLEAVLEALISKKLMGAGLDVLENEKLDKLSGQQLVTFTSLSKLPNVIFSPHVAGWTHESYVRINEVLVEKIVQL